MSGSMSQNKTDSANQSEFSQRVFKQQVPYLKSLYQQGANLFGSSMANSGPTQQRTENTFNSANPAWQQQLQGGAYSGLDSNQVANDLRTSMGQPSNQANIYASVMGGKGNNYADALKDVFVKDADRAQGLMLKNLDARAGYMSGGSRHGVATAMGMDDINRNLQSNLTKTGYDTFDKDLNNKLTIAQQADSNNMSRQQMLLDMLTGKQNAISSALGNTGAMQNLGMAGMNVPWQLLNNYKGIIGGPLTLASGSSSGWATDRGFSGGGGM
jgi:hypothetical protein